MPRRSSIYTKVTDFTGPGGMIWVPVGYGEWSLFPSDDPKVGYFAERLARDGDMYKGRLTAYLSTRQRKFARLLRGYRHAASRG
ncbi:MAG: hypothetical protein OHK0046_47510 [Anaerolineae bacterium]